MPKIHHRAKSKFHERQASKDIIRLSALLQDCIPRPWQSQTLEKNLLVLAELMYSIALNYKGKPPCWMYSE